MRLWPAIICCQEDHNTSLRFAITFWHDVMAIPGRVHIESQILLLSLTSLVPIELLDSYACRPLEWAISFTETVHLNLLIVFHTNNRSLPPAAFPWRFIPTIYYLGLQDNVAEHGSFRRTDADSFALASQSLESSVPTAPIFPIHTYSLVAQLHMRPFVYIWFSISSSGFVDLIHRHSPAPL